VLGRWLAVGLGVACVLALAYCVWGIVTSDPARLPWASSRSGGIVARHPVTWFAEPKKGSGKLELIDLVHGDQVIVKKIGPTRIPAG
jgi:hypothetical protein